MIPPLDQQVKSVGVKVGGASKGFCVIAGSWPFVGDGEELGGGIFVFVG